MPRVKYPNQRYLQKQKVAFQETQIFSDKELAQRLGVTRRMLKLYKSGQVPVPIDLLYIKAMEDVNIAVWGSNFIKHVWSI